MREIWSKFGPASCEINAKFIGEIWSFSNEKQARAKRTPVENHPTGYQDKSCGSNKIIREYLCILVAELKLLIHRTQVFSS